MPSVKRQVGTERLGLVSNVYSTGRLKPTERSRRGSLMDAANVPLVCSLSERQSRSGEQTLGTGGLLLVNHHEA